MNFKLGDLRSFGSVLSTPIVNLKFTLYFDLCNHLCSGRRFPVAVSVDKMTQKKWTGQITALATIIPEASPSKMVQTCFLANPVIKGHDGPGLAKAAAIEFKKILNTDYISQQIISGGTDGQYFHLHFEKNLDELLQLKVMFSQVELLK